MHCRDRRLLKDGATVLNVILECNKEGNDRECHRGWS